MLETFGMQKGGKKYRRLVGAFERIFGATIFFGTEKLGRRAKVVHRCRFSFIREAQIRFNRGDGLPSASAGFENEIVLSDEFYQELIAHPIPTDLEAVRVLSSAPRFWIYSCGSRTDASSQKVERQSHCLTHSVSSASLAASSTRDRGASAQR
jgi:hypothetical protein